LQLLVILLPGRGAGRRPTVRLEILGENPSPVRGGADREAARVRIVVGDEDDEGEADHQGYRAGTGGVEGGAARTDKDGVAEDDEKRLRLTGR
jgi:hypothetical protein